MKQIKVKCPAKINVFFNIVGLDERNYHLVHGLNESISLYDYLEIKTTDTKDIVLTCNNPSIPLDEKNSVYKAANIFLEYTKITTGLEIHIEKNIPTEAGLGGESTDAAGTILALDYLFSTNLSKEELNNLGYKTSCDVPFCIVGGTCEVQGCGEIVKKSSIPYKYYLVITPNIGHSTQEMFKLFDTQTKYYQTLPIKIGYNDFHKVLNQDIKDLIMKVINNTKAITSMLTGSGSSIIGIYETKEKLDNAYEIMTNLLDPSYKIFKTHAVDGIKIIKS